MKASQCGMSVGGTVEADFSHQRKMRINLGSKEETDEGVLEKFPFVFFPPSWQIMICSRAVGFVPSSTRTGACVTPSPFMKHPFH